MSFLDLYQGDQAQAATIQPNEGHDLPSGFLENFHAAWSDGQLFSQSIARANARAAVLGDYIDEIRQKTGNDLTKEFIPDAAGGGQTGVTDFDTANERVAKLKESYPDLDLNPITEDEINQRAIAKAQAAHRNYEALQAGEKTGEGSIGSFFGSAFSSAADPINILALPAAHVIGGGVGILSAALRWGALAGVSQAAIEASSDTFKEQVQPGYMESGAPIKEIGGAALGGAVLGGGIKALGNAWTRVKTGQWPTSVRDAGNVIESEANVAQTNPFPGVEGEVAHREVLTKTIDDILAGRPVDVSAQVTPELSKFVDAYHGSPTPFTEFSEKGPYYFTPHPEVAGEYAVNTSEEGFARLQGREFEDDTKQPHIVRADLQMEKPFTADMWNLEEAAKARDPEWLKANGYDSAVLKDKRDPTGTEFIVLDRNQIRPKYQQLSMDFEATAKPKPQSEPGLQPELQTPEQMAETLTAPAHQDAIRADIDRARAVGDVQVPGVDELGNHTMVSVDAAMDEVDAYKQAAEQIQACANPVQEAAE
jgi:hypothetical protein